MFVLFLDSLINKLSKMRKQLIKKIQRANGIGELFDTLNWKAEYRAAIKLLHPDKTDDPAAAKALIRLNSMRARFEKGQQLTDDAGLLQAYSWGAVFQGHHQLLAHSEANFEKLKSRRNKAARHFHQFMPTSLGKEAGLCAKWQQTAFYLSGKKLAQRHVQWILSRLLEFAAWLAQEGYVHAGLHPESIWIVPQTHGIIIPTYYHARPLGSQLSTLSSTYQHWYPSSVFENKKAVSLIDIEMIKRTAIYLLRDTSGAGVKLKGTVSSALLDFLQAKHTDVYQCYDEYRYLLKRNFKSEFHELVF